ncbi:5-hydroxytryptamine receptor 7-like [Amphiura filiformis]|uniref:5-hydroxytryptamine receptor 7-like n=1 Tax=Amphiura filiformis TaxID=82378 RepID=UPI003B21392D
MDSAYIAEAFDGMILTNLINGSSTGDMNTGCTNKGLMNDTPSQPHRPAMPVIPTSVIITAHSLMFIIGGLGNIGTISTFALDPKLREKASDFIILALAVADSYICLVETTFIVVTEVMGTWIFGDVCCKMRYVMLASCLNAGINLILTLSWDRYLLLAKEYGGYVKMQTRKMIFALIIIAWICAVIPVIAINVKFAWRSSLINVGTHLQCWPASSFSSAYLLTELLLLRCFPIGLVLIFGVLFLIRLRQRLFQSRTSFDGMVMAGTSRVSTGNTDHQEQKAARVLRKRYQKPTIMYAAFVFALILCTTPLSIYAISFTVICPEFCFQLITLDSLILVAYFNSCINPILYALTNRKVRQFYARYLQKVFKTERQRVN